MPESPIEKRTEIAVLSQEAKKYKTADEFVKSQLGERVFWHSSPSGYLRGSKYGLHIGTKKAAKQAIEARIGVPADGKGWDGTKEYGKTLLAGRNTLKKFGIHETGFNVGTQETKLPEEDFYINDHPKLRKNAKYSNGELVALDAKPIIIPVKIKGKMTNTVYAPMEDFKANSIMQGQLKKGTAKSGYYYINVGEDEGSISAVIPSSAHIEILKTETQLKDIWNKAKAEGYAGCVHTVRESREISKLYYTSTDPVFGKITMKQFIETEVEERGNYSVADVQKWIRKYGLSMTDLAIWVSPKKWVANRYNLLAEEWDEAEKIPESEMRVYEIKGNEGFIIPESDDGDEGYLFVFKRVMTPVIRESENQGTAPGQHEKINKIIEDVKKKPLRAPEKRDEIRRELTALAGSIDQSAITELRNFRPLGMMSEFGAAMGAEPRKGVRIDTPFGPYVFDEKRIPSKERADRWYAQHKEAEGIRTLAAEYAFGLGASPNTVTGNFRVVERGRRFKEQGMLSPEEEKALNALEKYWQDHPELDRQKGYGIWGHNLEIMVPESLRDKMIEKKGSLIDAILKSGPGEAIPIEYKDVPLGKRILLPSNITGSEIQRRGDLIVVAVQVDRDIVAYLYVQKGSQLIQIRPVPWQKTQVKPGELVNTIEYNMWVERIKKEAPEYLPEWEIFTQAGIRAGDTIIHKTAKYTAVVDKVYKNGNADITVLEAKGIPEWEKSIKEGFPIKTTVKGADIDRYFEKAAIKGTEAKQPWQMTRSEAIAEAAKPLGPMGISWGEMRTALSTSRKFAESMHKDMVKLAIVERKPVPPEVLKEYPDLIAKKKEPWEMTYREFADFFIDVWGEQKFTFAERVGKPLGIQSQAGEPYHMIKGKRIGYSGSLERDRWRLAIVDKALSEGKKVPEEVLAELSESLKHEREKLGGTGMAEQYEEKPPGQEVRDWMRKALGIEDYKGGRHDRIQMLALLIQNSELGNIRSINEAGQMARALGKDLGYGEPPAYGKSQERYYGEKIAAETGKEVHIIKSSDIIKPPAKEPDVQEIFDRYTKGYSKLSFKAVTYLSDTKLAMEIQQAVPEISAEGAKRLAPTIRGMAEKKYSELEEQEVKAPAPAESGAIAGGTPARQILRVTEPEGYYFGTQIEVLQGANPELEPYFTGTIKRLLNNGELVEVHPDGDPREVSFRVPVDRVNVIRLQQEGEPTRIKKLYRYYYLHRPPSIGTQPEGFINHESWLPAKTTPHGSTAFGWVEYDRPLTPEEKSRYELFEDEVELPKLVKELVQFAHDEGIDEAMKAIDAEYGRAVWEWLKSQKRIRAGLGQKEQVRAEIIRLAGITDVPKSQVDPEKLHITEKAKLFLTALKKYKTPEELAQQKATVERLAEQVPELADELINTYLERSTYLKSRGKPAKDVLTEKEPEDYYFRTEVTVEPEFDEPYGATIKRLLNNGTVVEVNPKGTAPEVGIRVNIERVFIFDLKTRPLTAEELRKKYSREKPKLLATPPAAPPSIEKIKPEQAIKIAADSIEQLRRVDVFRVLNQYKENSIEIGNYIKSNRPDLVAEVDKILGEFQPKDKFAEIQDQMQRDKDKITGDYLRDVAGQMTSKEFINEALKLNRYRDKYEKDPKLMNEFTSSGIQKWKELVEKRGEVGKLPDKVIEDYVQLFGEKALFSVFRGTKAKGIEGWRIPAVPPAASPVAPQKIRKATVLRFSGLEFIERPDGYIDWDTTKKYSASDNTIKKAINTLKYRGIPYEVVTKELSTTGVLEDVPSVPPVPPAIPTPTHLQLESTEALYKRYTSGYSAVSLLGIVRQESKDLAHSIGYELKLDTMIYTPAVLLPIAEKFKEYAQRDYNVEHEKHEKKRLKEQAEKEKERQEGGQAFWDEVKNLKVVDFEVQHDVNPDKPTRTYYHVYDRTFAILENGKKVQVSYVIYKGEEGKRALKATKEFYMRIYGQYMGNPLSEWITYDQLMTGNRYEDYKAQQPKPRFTFIPEAPQAAPPAIQPSPGIQARFNAYIKSTVLQTGALASPKFLSDERMAQDIERNIQVSKDEARSFVPQFRAIAEKMINKEEVESVKELFGIDVEQEAHNLGIDLADYVITKAGSRIFLQHKTIVQRQYEIKSPAGFMKRQEEETQERLRKAEKPEARILRELRTKYRFSRPEGDMVAKAIDSYMKMRDKSIVYSILTPVRDGKFIADELMNTIEITYYGQKEIPVPPAVPPVAKPVQSIQEVKQQVLDSIQAARTVEELQPVLKGIGFLPLPEPEKRQVLDAYQNKYSILMSERPFGVPVKGEEKVKVIGALTPQQLFEADLRRKATESRTVSVTPTLTGGAVTSRKLEMFEPGAMEKAKAEAETRKRIEQLGLPYEVHPIIRKLAAGTQDVMKFGSKRGREAVEDIVLARYVRYCPPGTIIDNRSMPRVPERWWVFPQKLRACMSDIEKKLAEAGAGMVRESQRHRYSIYQDGRLFANEDNPTEANNIYAMLVRTFPKSVVELRENFVHPRIHQRTLKQYPVSREISVVREATQLTPSMRSYIRGAVAIRDVIHYYRDGRPPTRGVAYRARDGTYFVEAQDGQVYSSMGWEEVGAQPQGVREPARYAGGCVRATVARGYG